MTAKSAEAMREIRNLCAERHPHTSDETIPWLAVHELLRQIAEAGEDSPESNEVLAASPVDGGSSAASLLPSEPMSNDGWRHRLIHLHSECPACLAATQPAAETRPGGRTLVTTDADLRAALHGSKP